MFQINRFMNDRNHKQWLRRASSRGAQHARENGLDEQSACRGHRADDRHQDDGDDQQEPVAPDVADEAAARPS